MQQTHVLFNGGFMLVYLYDVVPVLKEHLQQSGLWNLKGLNQAKIKKCDFLHGHRLELKKF